MQYFMKIAQGVDTIPALLELQRNPQLWGQDGERKYAPDTPHGQMSDIWVRYNDRRPFDSGLRPFSEFNDEHDSVWYPAINSLPSVRDIAHSLMARVRGERLGGILITKLAPGGRLAGHIDGGWHAGYYDKYYVALSNEPGSSFWFGQPEERSEMLAETGDVHWFRNDVLHGVENNSASDRISMIVCIKHGRPWS